MKIIVHILRQDRESYCIVAMTWKPEAQRTRERPRTVEERVETGLKTEEEARMLAVYRKDQDTM